MAFPTDQTVSRPGQYESAGDARLQFEELFSGEVLTAFNHTCIAMGLTRSRSIMNGKSYSFPLIGRNSAKYHTPGQLIDTNSIDHAKRLVTIDDVAISPVFIAEIDEAMNHYEVRSQYSTECGEALAELIDRNIFRMIAKAATIVDKAGAVAAGLNPLDDETYTANITLGAIGDELIGAKIVDAIFKARTQLKNARVREKAVVVLRPEQYEALVNVSDVTKVAWMNKDVGGVGNTADGVIPRVAGLAVYESLQLPDTDESAGLTDPEPLAGESGNTAKYRGDYSTLVGLVFTESAVATLKLMDVQVEHIPEPLRLGHNILGKMAVGHNILRPCCAVAIYKTLV